MKIDFFRALQNNFRNNNETRNFIEELSNNLEKDGEMFLNNLHEILKQIKRENKVSLISENIIIKEGNEIIKDFQDKTGIIREDIMQMANKVLEEQNIKLEEYRKEGHLYMVEEDVNDRVYLLDLTSKSNHVFEEVDFPKELIGNATEGAVFIFENGIYRFYSYDGYEILYNN